MATWQTHYKTDNFNNQNWWDLYCSEDLNKITEPAKLNFLFKTDKYDTNNYNYDIKKDICLPTFKSYFGDEEEGTPDPPTINIDPSTSDEININVSEKYLPSSYYRRFREMRWENQDNLPLIHKVQKTCKPKVKDNKSAIEECSTYVRQGDCNSATDKDKTTLLCSWGSDEGDGNTDSSVSLGSDLYGSKVNIMNNLQNHGLNECIRPIAPPKIISDDSLYYLPKYFSSQDKYEKNIIENGLLKNNMKDIRANVVQWAGIQNVGDNKFPILDNVPDSDNKIKSSQSLFKSTAGSYDAYVKPCQKYYQNPTEVLTENLDTESTADTTTVLTSGAVDPETDPSTDPSNKCHFGWNGSDMLNRDGFTYGQPNLQKASIHPKKTEKDGSFTKGRGLNLSYSSKYGLDEEEQKNYQKHENINLENQQLNNYSPMKPGKIDNWGSETNPNYGKYNERMKEYTGDIKDEYLKYYDYYPVFKRNPDFHEDDQTSWTHSNEKLDMYNMRFDGGGEWGGYNLQSAINPQHTYDPIYDKIDDKKGNYYIGDYNLMLGGGEHPGWKSKNNWNRHPWDNIIPENPDWSSGQIEQSSISHYDTIKSDLDLDNTFSNTNHKLFYENTPKCVSLNNYVYGTSDTNTENICNEISKKYMWVRNYDNFKKECESKTITQNENKEYTEIGAEQKIDGEPTQQNICKFIPHNYRGINTNIGNDTEIIDLLIDSRKVDKDDSYIGATPTNDFFNLWPGGLYEEDQIISESDFNMLSSNKLADPDEILKDSPMNNYNYSSSYWSSESEGFQNYNFSPPNFLSKHYNYESKKDPPSSDERKIRDIIRRNNTNENTSHFIKDVSKFTSVPDSIKSSYSSKRSADGYSLGNKISTRFNPGELFTSKAIINNDVTQTLSHSGLGNTHGSSGSYDDFKAPKFESPRERTVAEGRSPDNPGHLRRLDDGYVRTFGLASQRPQSQNIYADLLDLNNIADGNIQHTLRNITLSKKETKSILGEVKCDHYMDGVQAKHCTDIYKQDNKFNPLNDNSLLLNGKRFSWVDPYPHRNRNAVHTVRNYLNRVGSTNEFLKAQYANEDKNINGKGRYGPLDTKGTYLPINTYPRYSKMWLFNDTNLNKMKYPNNYETEYQYWDYTDDESFRELNQKENIDYSASPVYRMFEYQDRGFGIGGAKYSSNVKNRKDIVKSSKASTCKNQNDGVNFCNRGDNYMNYQLPILKNMDMDVVDGVSENKAPNIKITENNPHQSVIPYCEFSTLNSDSKQGVKNGTKSAGPDKGMVYYDDGVLKYSDEKETLDNPISYICPRNWNGDNVVSINYDKLKEGISSDGSNLSTRMIQNVKNLTNSQLTFNDKKYMDRNGNWILLSPEEQKERDRRCCGLEGVANEKIDKTLFQPGTAYQEMYCPPDMCYIDPNGVWNGGKPSSGCQRLMYEAERFDGYIHNVNPSNEEAHHPREYQVGSLKNYYITSETELNGMDSPLLLEIIKYSANTTLYRYLPEKSDIQNHKDFESWFSNISMILNNEQLKEVYPSIINWILGNPITISCLSIIDKTRIEGCTINETDICRSEILGKLSSNYKLMKYFKEYVDNLSIDELIFTFKVSVGRLFGIQFDSLSTENDISEITRFFSSSNTGYQSKNNIKEILRSNNFIVNTQGVDTNNIYHNRFFLNSESKNNITILMDFTENKDILKQTEEFSNQYTLIRYLWDRIFGLKTLIADDYYIERKSLWGIYNKHSLLRNMLNTIDQKLTTKQNMYRANNPVFHNFSLKYEKMIVTMKEFIQEDFFNLMYYYEIDTYNFIQDSYSIPESYTDKPELDKIKTLLNEGQINSLKTELEIAMPLNETAQIYINSGINEIKEQLKYSTERKFTFPNSTNLRISDNYQSIGMDCIIDYLTMASTEDNKSKYIFNNNLILQGSKEQVMWIKENLSSIINMSKINNVGGPLIEITDSDNDFLTKFISYGDVQFSDNDFFINQYDPPNFKDNGGTDAKYINQMNTDDPYDLTSIFQNIQQNIGGSESSLKNEFYTDNNTRKYITNYFNLNPDIEDFLSDNNYCYNIYNIILCPSFWESFLVRMGKTNTDQALVIDLPWLLAPGTINKVNQMPIQENQFDRLKPQGEPVTLYKNFIDLSDILYNVLSLNSGTGDQQMKINRLELLMDRIINRNNSSDELSDGIRDHCSRIEPPPTKCYNYFQNIVTKKLKKYAFVQVDSSYHLIIPSEQYSFKNINDSIYFNFAHFYRESECSKACSEKSICQLIVTCDGHDAEKCTSTGLLTLQSVCGGSPPEKQPQCRPNTNDDSDTSNTSPPDGTSPPEEDDVSIDPTSPMCPSNINANDEFLNKIETLFEYFKLFTKLTYKNPCINTSRDDDSNYVNLNIRIIFIFSYIFLSVIFTLRYLSIITKFLEHPLLIIPFLFSISNILIICYVILKIIQNYNIEWSKNKFTQILDTFFKSYITGYNECKNTLSEGENIVDFHDNDTIFYSFTIFILLVIAIPLAIKN